jgi:hypothetical protein
MATRKGKSTKNGEKPASILPSPKTYPTPAPFPLSGALKGPESAESEKISRELDRELGEMDLRAKLYATSSALSPEALQSRKKYAEDDGVWNHQTDIWLREAQSFVEQVVIARISNERLAYDQAHPLEPSSFFDSGALHFQLNPFYTSFLTDEEGEMVPVVVPSPSSASEAKVTSTAEQAADADIAAAQADQIAEDAAAELAAAAAAKRAADCGSSESVSAEAAEAAEKAEKEAERRTQRKKRNSAEKLARLVVHTPWDLVAKRLQDMRSPQLGEVSAKACRARFVKTFPAFEAFDAQNKATYLPPPPPPKGKEGNESGVGDSGGGGGDSKESSGGGGGGGETGGGDDQDKEENDDDDGFDITPHATSGRSGTKKKSSRKKSKAKSKAAAAAAAAAKDDGSGVGCGESCRDEEEGGGSKSRRNSGGLSGGGGDKGSGQGSSNELVVLSKGGAASSAVAAAATQTQQLAKRVAIAGRRSTPSCRGRGDAAIHVSCLSGRSIGTTEMLINRGCDMDQRSTSDGATPLLRACEGGNPHIVKLLLDKGCDREVEDNLGRNAVHIAGMFKWLDLVEVLLDEGAPKCKLNRGKCIACKLMMKLLVRKREQRRIASSKGSTRSPEERQAAIDAAMAAFETEFGTFEDEVNSSEGFGGGLGGLVGSGETDAAAQAEAQAASAAAERWR